MTENGTIGSRELIPEKGDLIAERPTTAIPRRKFCEGKHQGITIRVQRKTVLAMQVQWCRKI